MVVSRLLTPWWWGSTDRLELGVSMQRCNSTVLNRVWAFGFDSLELLGYSAIVNRIAWGC